MEARPESPPETSDGRVRTIGARSPVAPEYVRGGRPILAADPSNPWESRVVLNPAAVLVEAGPELESLCESWAMPENRRARLRAAGGACVMLYRAQGEADPQKDFHPSSVGLAVLTPQLDLVQRWHRPVLEPREPYHALGVEDPRCTKVADTYYVYYTGYSAPRRGMAGRDDSPGADGVTRICLATTRDFVDWTLHGPVGGDLQGPVGGDFHGPAGGDLHGPAGGDFHGPAGGDLHGISNKNAALFPEPVRGKWLLLHRPMAGPDAMTIHLAESRDPGGPWITRGRFMESYPFREFARSWIGAGAPPISLGDDRFLMLYHQGHFTEEGSREYDLAAALIDFRAPDPVVSRIEPLMRPARRIERSGDPLLGVDNVLFTCAIYRWNNRLMVPYAASDSRIFGASFPFERLVTVLEARAD